MAHSKAYVVKFDSMRDAPNAAKTYVGAESMGARKPLLLLIRFGLCCRFIASFVDIGHEGINVFISMVPVFVQGE